MKKAVVGSKTALNVSTSMEFTVESFVLGVVQKEFIIINCCNLDTQLLCDATLSNWLI